MTELQIDRSKLVEAAREGLRRIEIAEEIISRLDDVIDEERRSVYDERSRLTAVLNHAGITFGDGINDLENAAQRLADEGAS